MPSYEQDHGSYTTVDVVCAYNGYLASGDPAFTSACGNFKLLK